MHPHSSLKHMKKAMPGSVEFEQSGFNRARQRKFALAVERVADTHCGAHIRN